MAAKCSSGREFFREIGCRFDSRLAWSNQVFRSRGIDTVDLRPLLEILSDGSFHSGEKIGRALSINLAAVRQQIEKLRQMGIEIRSAAGKGYRIPVRMNLLSRQSILRNLGPDAFVWDLRLKLAFTTKSTNSDAMSCGQAGADSVICIAEHQAEGRGRRGREWQSPLGSNIYMSMLFSVQCGIAALEGLSLAVAVMVVRALQESGYSGFGLKWPNDILLDGRKIAGILLELSGDVRGPCKFVIGIGINTQLSAECRDRIEQPVAALAESFVQTTDRNMIVACLIRELSAGVKQFTAAGFPAFQEAWEALDHYRGKHVQIGGGPAVLEGLVRGVDIGGGLLLETVEGIQVIQGGELAPSVRLA
jgi:BirA family biotin operon repressor/biotin-[acetyl-CoA-carboxylase] ligase